MSRRRQHRPSPEEELYSFLDQRNISERNIERVQQLKCHTDAGVAKLAGVVLKIARVKSHRRRRMPFIARDHPELFREMVAVLGDSFWDDFFVRYGEQPGWVRKRFDQARWELDFEELGSGPCWCGSGDAYWLCCADRDDAFAQQLAAEEQERAWALDPESIPWWHPESGISHTTRSAYEMFFADPDHPYALPPPGWETPLVSTRPERRRRR